MDSRLLALAISLLPKNARQSLDNPIQWNRLPDHAGVELDYPVFQDIPEVAKQKTAFVLLLVSLIGPLMWLDGALYGYFKFTIPFLDGGIKIVVLLTAFAFSIFGIFGYRRPLIGFAVTLFLIPFNLTLLLQIPFTTVAAALTFSSLVALSDRLVVFYLYLNTAAPIQPQESRLLRWVCRRRWTLPFARLDGCELYALNYLLLFVPLVFVEIELENLKYGRPSFGTIPIFICVIVAGFAWPRALDTIIGLIFRRRIFTHKQMFGAFGRAIVDWFTYNRMNAQGVGVHQSPVGNCRARRILLVSVIFSWACLFIGSQDTTVDVASEKRAQERQLWGQVFSPVVDLMNRSPHLEGRKPEPQLAEPELSFDEKNFLSGMRPEQVEGYRAERTRRHKAEYSEFKKKSAVPNQAGQDSTAFLMGTFILFATVAASILVPTFGTLLSCLALIYGLTARYLAGVEELALTNPRKRVLSPDNWEFLVERVCTSEDEIEKDSIFMGTNSRDDTPILIPREVFQEHAHILGDSGSGKTSLGIMPLVSQLIRRGDSSVIIIDLKADDQALFETLRIEAEKVPKRNPKDYSAGETYPCRWFTTALDKSSYHFNPLTQDFMSKLPTDQQTDFITAALGLQYGTDYGRKFFGDANYELLNYTLETFPELDTFAKLAEVLSHTLDFPLLPEIKRNASNVVTSIRRLAHCKALNGSWSSGTPQSFLENAIDFSDVFDIPQVIYFGLPPVSGISTTASIARFAIYSLLGAAQMRAKRERKQVYLVVDEFQRIVANNLALFLQTARSMGIGVILSNQSLSDLELSDANLIPAVRTNTRFRQVYAVGTRDDIRDIRDTAGESLVGMRSWSLLPHFFGPATVQSINVSETVTPRMLLNDILLATDAFGRSIACLRRGAGYAQFGGMPFIMDSVHHISKDEYDRRRELEWPSPNEATDVATLDTEGGEDGPVVGGLLPDPEPSTDADDKLTIDETAAEQVDGAEPNTITLEPKRIIGGLLSDSPSAEPSITVIENSTPQATEEGQDKEPANQKEQLADVPIVVGVNLTDANDSSSSSEEQESSTSRGETKREEDDDDVSTADKIDALYEEDQLLEKNKSKRKRKQKRDEEENREFPFGGAIL